MDIKTKCPVCGKTVWKDKEKGKLWEKANPKNKGFSCCWVKHKEVKE